MAKVIDSYEVWLYPSGEINIAYVVRNEPRDGMAKSDSVMMPYDPNEKAADILTRAKTVIETKEGIS